MPLLSSSSRTTKGYSIALVSAVILSTTAIFIRYLTQTYQMPALLLAFWRDTIVALFLFPLLGIFRPRLARVNSRHLSYLIIYGFVLAIFNSTWTLSVALNGAAVATVLVYSSAGFTALLGWWFLKERLGWVKILAVGLSLGGCVMVAGVLNPGNWQGNLSGIITGIIAGLCYAIYSLMGRSASTRGLNPWTTLLYTFGFAAVFLLAINLIFGGILPGTPVRTADFFWLGNSAAGWGILFVLAAGPTVAGFGLYNVSLSLLPSSVANLIVSLEPAFTAVIAYFFLGEQLNGAQIGGGLMIFAGVVILRIFEGQPAKEAVPEPEKLIKIIRE